MQASVDVVRLDLRRARHQHLDAAVALAQQGCHVCQDEPSPGGIHEPLLSAQVAGTVGGFVVARTEDEHQVGSAQVVTQAARAFEQRLLGGRRVVQQVGQEVALQAQAGLNDG